MSNRDFVKSFVFIDLSNPNPRFVLEYSIFAGICCWIHDRTHFGIHTRRKFAFKMPAWKALKCTPQSIHTQLHFSNLSWTRPLTLHSTDWFRCRCWSEAECGWIRACVPCRFFGGFSREFGMNFVWIPAWIDSGMARKEAIKRRQLELKCWSVGEVETCGYQWSRSKMEEKTEGVNNHGFVEN